MALTWNAREVLGIDPSLYNFTCVGTTLAGARCRNTTTSVFREEASFILGDLGAIPLSNDRRRFAYDTLRRLYRLAEILLCLRWHRYRNSQIVEVANRWYSMVMRHRSAILEQRVAYTYAARPLAILPPTPLNNAQVYLTPPEGLLPLNTPEHWTMSPPSPLSLASDVGSHPPSPTTPSTPSSTATRSPILTPSPSTTTSTLPQSQILTPPSTSNLAPAPSISTPSPAPPTSAQPPIVTPPSTSHLATPPPSPSPSPSPPTSSTPQTPIPAPLVNVLATALAGSLSPDLTAALKLILESPESVSVLAAALTRHSA